MSAKPSKQLGSLLGRVPSATATGQGATSASPIVPYAPAPEPTAKAAEATPTTNREVPLQVLIPEHVRKQIDVMRGATGKSYRQITLEALRAYGLDVSDKDIAGKRGLKKS